MLNMLNHLKPSQQRELAEVVQKICAITQADKIYCYGCRIVRHQRWSLFQDDWDSIEPAVTLNYDLVLVMPVWEHRLKDEIHSTLKEIPGISFGVTCIIYYLQEAMDLLENGDRFLCDLHHKAVLLHSSDNKGLSANPVPLPDLVNKEAESNWAEWMARAGRNLAFAKESYPKEQFRLAAHLLYHSAIQVCNALVRFHTGYAPGTPILEELLSLCNNFSDIRTCVFPGSTPEEFMLLDTLSKARHVQEHNDPCVVTKEICGILIQRVEDLHREAHEYYHEKTGTAAGETGGGMTVDKNGLLGA